MKQMRRTTVTAPSDALDTLRAEARRRGISLAALIAETLGEKAAALRRERPKPRLGTGRSADGKAAADIMSEPVADPYR